MCSGGVDFECGRLWCAGVRARICEQLCGLVSRTETFIHCDVKAQLVTRAGRIVRAFRECRDSRGISEA